MYYDKEDYIRQECMEQVRDSIIDNRDYYDVAEDIACLSGADAEAKEEYIDGVIEMAIDDVKASIDWDDLGIKFDGDRDETDDEILVRKGMISA
jgi:hypothetical protein